MFGYMAVGGMRTEWRWKSKAGVETVVPCTAVLTDQNQVASGLLLVSIVLRLRRSSGCKLTPYFDSSVSVRFPEAFAFGKVGCVSSSNDSSWDLSSLWTV